MISVASVQKIVIHWVSETTSGHVDLLKDFNGNPLSAGISGNGDGCLVSLGYFKGATSEEPFKGTWKPLTFGTRIGDSSSGYGFEDGMFAFTTQFSKDSDKVLVYPYRPASYVVTSSVPVTVETPPAGTPICIRFYDGTALGLTARYNTVTGPGWKWPAFSSGIPQNLYLKVASGTAPSNSTWNYGNQFEDPDHNFTTGMTTQFSLVANSTLGGTINDVNGSYDYGSSISIQANPSEHMEFLHWIGEGVEDRTKASTTVIINQDRNLTAVFGDISYQLSVFSQGGGTASFSGDGTYTYNENVPLSAIALDGHLFSHWLGYGPDSNESETSLFISGDQNLTAVFIPKSYDVEISSSAGGEVQYTNSSFEHDHNYTLTALPENGYYFSHWSSLSDSLDRLTSSSESTTVLEVNGSASFTANFLQITYLLEVENSTGGKSVSPSTQSHSVLTKIEVNATAMSGYDFTKWDDPFNVLDNNRIANTIADLSRSSENSKITALFEKKTYPVEVNSTNGGNVTLNPSSGPWIHGSSYNLIAIPQAGYIFKRWIGNTNSIQSLQIGTEIEKTANNLITVTNPISLTAEFESKIYEIQILSNGNGEISGEGNYTIHDNAIVSASADPGWQFSHWSGHDSYLYAPEANFSKVNLANSPSLLNFTANFVRETYNISVRVDGDGLINGKSALLLAPDSGTMTNLIAEPSSGWNFDRWQGYPVPRSDDHNISFVPNAGGEIIAKFSKKFIQLEIGNSPGGDTKGSGTYQYDSNISLSATPHEGYYFDQWMGDISYLNDAKSRNPVIHIPDNNISINPLFKPIPFDVSVSLLGKGSVTGEGLYVPGQSVFLEAQGAGIDELAPRGYKLKQWKIDKSNGETFLSSDNPLQFIIDANYSVLASFTAIPPDTNNFVLSANPSLGGILFDDPGQRIWNQANDLIGRKISASSGYGYSFLGWTSNENLSFSPNWSSPEIQVETSSDSVVQANFSKIHHMIKTEHNSSHGLIMQSNYLFPHDTVAELEAIPMESHDFEKWEIIKSFSYKVSSDRSLYNPLENKLFINDMESPSLILIRGFTYFFECNLSEGNHFYLSTENSSQNFSLEYDNGVSNSRVSSGTLTFTVPEDAPDTLYYCSSEGIFKGNKIEILSKNEEDMLALIPYPENNRIFPKLQFDLSLKASFQLKNFEVQISSSIGGSLENEGIVNAFYGEEIELSATEEAHYEFSHWEGSTSLANDSRLSTKLVVSENSSIKANFIPVEYDLSLSTFPPTGGSAYTADNNYHFPFGSVVQLSASPTSDYSFVSWTGPVVDESSSTTEVIILGPTSISANLEKKTTDVTLEVTSLDYLGSTIGPNPSIGGKIEGPSTVKVNDSYSYNALPESGFRFLSWQDQQGSTLSSNPTSFFSFSSPSSIIASFQQLSYPINVSSNSPDEGRVQWIGVGSGSSLESIVPHGSTIQMIAKPASDFVFSHWESDNLDLFNHTEPFLEVLVTQSATLSPVFTAKSLPSITFEINPSIGGNATHEISSIENTFLITAEAHEGFRFKQWIGDGIADPNSAATSLYATVDQLIYAEFIELPKTYELKTFVSASESGLAFGSGFFGDELTPVGAEPNYGYEFVEWNDPSGILLDILSPSTQANMSGVSEAVFVTAIFSPKSFPVMIQANEGGTILANPSEGPWIYSQNYEITAVANPGYVFSNWSGDQFSESCLVLETTDPNNEITVRGAISLIANFAPESAIELLVSTSDPEYGTVFGSGRFYKEKVQVQAVPRSGYRFLNWNDPSAILDDKDQAITSADMEKATSSVIVTANFEPVEFLVNISTGEGGTYSIESSEGTWLYSNIYDLKAIPDEGYLFSGWSGNQSSTESLLEGINTENNKILVTENIELFANFVSNLNRSLDVVSSNAKFGTTSGSGIFANEETMVSAEPANGYRFVKWEDPLSILSSDKNPLTTARMGLASSDVVVTAIFEPHEFEVEISEGEGGTITLSSPNGPWLFGETYELNAEPIAGFEFSHWSGDSDSMKTLTSDPKFANNQIIVSQDVNLLSNFYPISFDLRVEATGGGSTSGSGIYSFNDSPIIQGSPAEGWVFERWVGPTEYLSSPESSKSLVTFPTSPSLEELTFTAVFERQTYQVNVSGKGSGLINGEENLNYFADSQTEVKLDAVPSAGWAFDRWIGLTGSNEFENQISLYPSRNISISANFIQQNFELQINQSNYGDANGTGSYLWNEKLVISAFPKSNYAFERWVGDIEHLEDPAKSTTTVTIPLEDITLTPIFTEIPVQLDIVTNGRGSVYGAGNYSPGEQVSLLAKGNSTDSDGPLGYELVRWEWINAKGDLIKSTVNPISVKLDSNLIINAFFEPILPDQESIIISISPEQGGNVYDDPSLRSWNQSENTIQRSLVAQANFGYSFAGWSSISEAKFTPNASYAEVIAVPPKSSTVTAHFQAIKHELTLYHDSSLGDVFYDKAEVEHGNTTTLIASPKANSNFDGWEIVREITYDVQNSMSDPNTGMQKLLFGNQQAPFLTLIKGFTYHFNCDISLVDSFFLSTSKEDSSYESEFTMGVVNSRANKGTLTFNVPFDAPDKLYYKTALQPFSGNEIKIIELEDLDILPFPKEKQISPYFEYDLAFKANFSIKNHELEITSSVGGSTNLSGSYNFNHGETVYLSALPQEHYEFVRWDGPLSISDKYSSNTNAVVDAGGEIRAIFDSKKYSLKLNASPENAGIAFTENNEYSFSFGTKVEIQVDVRNDSQFEFWTGPVSDRYASITEVEILGDTEITANLIASLGTLTKSIATLDYLENPFINNSEVGGLIIGGDTFVIGATPTLHAIAKDGFHFLRWEDETGNVISTSPTTSIRISNNTNVVAVFQQLSNLVSVGVDATDRGVIEWSGVGEGDSIETLVPYGQEIILNASPKSGFEFLRWSSPDLLLYGQNSPTLTVTANQPLKLQAEFTSNRQLELLIEIIPDGAGWAFGAGLFNSSPLHPIYAKANPGYVFSNWEGDGIVNVDSASSSIDLDADKKIIAYFNMDDEDTDGSGVQNPDFLHNLVVEASNQSHGTTSGTGVFATGWAGIQANANSGYRFDHWSGDGISNPMASITQVYVDKDTNVIANFEELDNSYVGNSLELNSGWWLSEWFGYYWKDREYSSFHEKLGWIEIHQENDESIWLWVHSLDGWYWTGKSSYPYMYDGFKNQWIWVHSNYSSPFQLILFNFTQDGGEWIKTGD